MALSSTIIWEFWDNATASMVNGGGFKTGATGTDFSQQAAAQYNLTGVTTAAADAIMLTASAAADMVGNTCRVVSGTNFTTGWYEIVSVVVGVSITVDRNCTSAAGAAGVVNIGGALSLNSTLDDDFFESIVAGNTVYFKQGTFTVGETMAIVATSATAITPINIIGYNSTRGDNPRGSTRPTIAAGANQLQWGQFMNVSHIIFTSTAASGCDFARGNNVVACKSTNTSTTAGRFAFRAAGVDVSFYDCEAISQNGIGIGFVANLRCKAIGCYIHDCETGLNSSNAGQDVIDCIFEGNRTAAITSTSSTGGWTIKNNTIYGREGKVGIGINLNIDPSPAYKIIGNIIYGLTTGALALTTEQKSNFLKYNCFNNNTTNATNITLDATDITTAPAFANVAQVTGSTATTSGSVLTQSGGDFSTVTDNESFLHVLSGTGVTTGGYLITSHTGTTLTVNNALGTSSAGDVTYYVTTKHDFAVGVNMKAAGAQSSFIGGLTNQYLDIGALQRPEPVTLKFVGPGGLVA